LAQIERLNLFESCELLLYFVVNSYIIVYLIFLSAMMVGNNL